MAARNAGEKVEPVRENVDDITVKTFSGCQTSPIRAELNKKKKKKKKKGAQFWGVS